MGLSLAALIACVPRYALAKEGYLRPDTDGFWMNRTDVLAALEAATPPDLVEAGKVADRLRAEKSVISTTRTFPSGDERDMVLVPHYGPNPLAHEAADTIRALIALATAQAAQIAGLEAALVKINVGEGWAAQIARKALKEAGHEPS